MLTFGKPRPRLSNPRRGAHGLSLLTAALAAAVVGAGLAAAVGPRAVASQPRCYWIDPPLTRFQPGLLNRGTLDCSLARCQFTLRRTTDAGWVCFFERPWG